MGGCGDGSFARRAGPDPASRLIPPACSPRRVAAWQRVQRAAVRSGHAQQCAQRCGPSCKSWTTTQCLGSRRRADGRGTTVTLGHRRVQPNAGAPRPRPARAVRFARMHGSSAVWCARGGPTRGELQRAWRWGKAGRRPMQRTRHPVALLLVMEVPIPRCSQQCRM